MDLTVSPLKKKSKGDYIYLSSINVQMMLTFFQALEKEGSFLMQLGKRRMMIRMAFLGLMVKDDLRARERRREAKNRTINNEMMDLYAYTQSCIQYFIYFTCNLMKLSVMIWMYRIYPLPHPLESSLTVRYNFTV